MAFNEEAVKKAVYDLLIAFGKEVDNTDLEDTPRRVCGYWKELLEGEQYTNAQIADMYGKTFKTKGNSLVVKKMDNVFSHCEHHLALMYNMSVVVAYLPTENDDGTYNVIGLSKIPRIVSLCCKRLQLQERIAADISECISLATGSPDVYVNIVADHACVSARGAKSEGLTDVTNLSGRFIDNHDLRNEIERKIRTI